MFSELNFEVPTKELFWQEKIMRSIKNSESIYELKEMATLLTKIATQRAGVISGLTKALMKAEFKESCLPPSDSQQPEEQL
jgi:hypothetical protein